MSKAQSKPEVDKPEIEVEDDQLNRAIEELRGVLSEEEKRPSAASTTTAGNNSVIFGIPVEVQIVLGSTEMPVSELMTLQ